MLISASVLFLPQMSTFLKTEETFIYYNVRNSQTIMKLMLDFIPLLL